MGYLDKIENKTSTSDEREDNQSDYAHLPDFRSIVPDTGGATFLDSTHYKRKEFDYSARTAVRNLGGGWEVVETLTGIVTKIDDSKQMMYIEFSKGGQNIVRSISISTLRDYAGQKVDLGDGVAIIMQRRGRSFLTSFEYLGQATFELDATEIDELKSLRARAKAKRIES